MRYGGVSQDLLGPTLGSLGSAVNDGGVTVELSCYVRRQIVWHKKSNQEGLEYETTDGRYRLFISTYYTCA